VGVGEDMVDWQAVRVGPVARLVACIRSRGMYDMLSSRIVAFLGTLVGRQGGERGAGAGAGAAKQAKQALPAAEEVAAADAAAGEAGGVGAEGAGAASKAPAAGAVQGEECDSGGGGGGGGGGSGPLRLVETAAAAGAPGPGQQQALPGLQQAPAAAAEGTAQPAAAHAQGPPGAGDTSGAAPAAAGAASAVEQAAAAVAAPADEQAAGGAGAAGAPLSLEWLRSLHVDDAREYLMNVRDPGLPAPRCSCLRPAAAAWVQPAAQRADRRWAGAAPAFRPQVGGLGRKSTACVLLLALGMKDFPVDVNVARIAARLGWIPIEVRARAGALGTGQGWAVTGRVTGWVRLATVGEHRWSVSGEGAVEGGGGAALWRAAACTWVWASLCSTRT
jgi:hypothetical protein